MKQEDLYNILPSGGYSEVPGVPGGIMTLSSSIRNSSRRMYPETDKVFKTLAQAQAYIEDNYNIDGTITAGGNGNVKNAVPGLILSVIEDGSNNGAYFVKNNDSTSTPGLSLEKVGSGGGGGTQGETGAGYVHIVGGTADDAYQNHASELIGYGFRKGDYGISVEGNIWTLTDSSTPAFTKGACIKGEGGDVIDDDTTALDKTWSSSKINNKFDALAYDYLTFTCISDGKILMDTNGHDVNYSKNGGEWTSWDGSAINCVSGDIVKFKGSNSGGFAGAHFNSDSTGTWNVSGNIMTLIDEYGYTLTIPNDECFKDFFKEMPICTAPTLPATTLTINCYQNMFTNCSLLTIAPDLPATILKDCCYMEMFSDCANLNYIKCLATDISATDCTLNWVTGVASTGTFVKNASMTSWTTGYNGIPSGWTIQEAGSGGGGVGPQGPKGDKGDQGDQGIQGETGSTGVSLYSHTEAEYTSSGGSGALGSATVTVSVGGTSAFKELRVIDSTIIDHYLYRCDSINTTSIATLTLIRDLGSGGGGGTQGPQGVTGETGAGYVHIVGGTADDAYQNYASELIGYGFRKGDYGISVEGNIWTLVDDSSSTPEFAKGACIKGPTGSGGGGGGDYLPLAGGIMTGTINSQNIIPTTGYSYSLGNTSERFGTLYVESIDIASYIDPSAIAGKIDFDTINGGMRFKNAIGNNYLFDSGNVRAAKFIRIGGSSNQYLMADGSIKTDGGNSYLPLAGGTMTGAINFDNGEGGIAVIGATSSGHMGEASFYIKCDNTIYLNPGVEVMTGSINSQSVLPVTNNSYDCGTTTKRWANIYGVNYYATTAFYQDSDARLKNVHGEIDLDKAYDLIEKCSTILYDLKDDETHKQNVGVIAQEIQEFFPEIVSEQGEDHMLSVDYSKLTVIIMRVLKDLIERVKKLEK